MTLQEWAEKYVGSAQVEMSDIYNPLRIRRDGWRRYADFRVNLIFKHRNDGDLQIPFTVSSSGYDTPTPSYLEGLRYVRRRMNYTRRAIESGEGVDAWINGGIRARLREVGSYDEMETHYNYHVSVFRLLLEWLGNDIFREFLDTKEGEEDDEGN